MRSGTRVLFVSYPADWVGPTQSLYLLLKYLDPSLSPAVLVADRGDFSDRVEELGVPVHLLPALTKWSLFRLVRLIRAQRVDLVYANNTNSML